MGFVDSEKKNKKMHQEPYPYIILVFGVMYCYYTAVWSSLVNVMEALECIFFRLEFKLHKTHLVFCRKSFDLLKRKENGLF